MALFGKKKETSAKRGSSAGAKAETAKAPAAAAGKRDLTHVLSQARITEKASLHQASGVYVFNIGATATKRDIVQAVKSLYSVTPRKVAVVTIPRKNTRNMRTGRSGVRGGGRKAYVYLKKGDSITIA